jgi:hypothetical protein
VLFLGGSLSGLRGTAEVAAAVGIQLQEAGVAAQHPVQRSEGRGDSFLGKEATVEDAPVGIVERDHQILPR